MQQQGKDRKRSQIAGGLICLVGALALIYAVQRVPSRYGAFSPGVHYYRISSASMEPTLRPGTTVAAARGYYLVNPPQLQDLVLMRKPEESRRPFAKRIVALPGDRVRVTGGRLWRNGKAVEEPYLKERMTYTWPQSGEVVVPKGCVVVLGDNRNDSNDCHLWSPPYVELKTIEGKIMPPRP